MRKRSRLQPFPILSVIAAFALLAPVCSAFDLGNIRVGDTVARQIARQADIVGKGQHGQCLPFAIELNKRLRAAGIKSQVVGYQYQDLGGHDLGNTRGHAVVVYEDGGRTYLMDNQSWAPRWIEGASVDSIVGQFGGMQVQVREAFVYGAPSRPAKGNGLAPRRASITPGKHQKPPVAGTNGLKEPA